jgi:hypothetical protein
VRVVATGSLLGWDRTAPTAANFGSCARGGGTLVRGGGGIGGGTGGGTDGGGRTALTIVATVGGDDRIVGGEVRSIVGELRIGLSSCSIGGTTASTSPFSFTSASSPAS